MAKRPWQDEDWLRKRWYSQMSTKEIAAEAGCKRVTIQKWGRKKFDFESRLEIPLEPYQDPDVLKRLYWDEQLTLPEIGERFNVTDATILRNMEKHEIPRRPSYVTRVLNKPGAGFVHADARGYEMIKHSVENTTKNYPIHRLIAIAEFGIDEARNKHVHHKNGIPWDNRADNIELLDPRKHYQSHDIERERDSHGRYR